MINPEPDNPYHWCGECDDCKQTIKDYDEVSYRNADPTWLNRWIYKLKQD